MTLKGLGAYRANQEKAQQGSGWKFYKPPADTKIKFRPLQELDENSKNLSKKNGLATFTTEWQNPSDFTKVVVDTTDEEGDCVGAELSRKYGWGDKDNPGWKPKNNMYFNALVDDGSGEPRVEVMQFNIGGDKSLGQTFIKFSDNRDDHSITNRWWSWERKGSGIQGTSHTIVPGDPDDFDVEAYELKDIDELLPKVPYASQATVLNSQAWEDRHGETVKAASDAARAARNGGTTKTAERKPQKVSNEW